MVFCITWLVLSNYNKVSPKQNNILTTQATLTSTVLYQKIDGFRYITKRGEAAVIGIWESKLHDLVRSSKIQIENYDLIQSDTNRRGSVGCFIRNDLS